MSQEIKYEEDFTGAEGALPAGWSKVELGADIGIQDNALDLNTADNFNGDGWATQNDAAGYLFSGSLDWDLRFDISITGLDGDEKSTEFSLNLGGGNRVGFRFESSGAQLKLIALPGSAYLPYEITIPQFPNKIRFRNISRTLFLDYDIGGGYEFDGGPAVSGEMDPGGLYYFAVFINSDSFTATSEFRVTLDNYIVLGDLIIISDFWHNHALQTEQDNLPGAGSLVKVSTIKIVKSTGQLYISPTEETGPKSSSSFGINYVCERVA